MTSSGGTTRRHSEARTERGSVALGRLASAADTLEERRDRHDRLQAAANELNRVDVVVVDGELAVLAALGEELTQARAALHTLAQDANDAEALRRFDALLASGAWAVFDEVERLINEKTVLADQARAEVQKRLGPWVSLSTRITQLLQEIQDRRLHVVESRELAAARNRMQALVRQASISYQEDQLLDAWRALEELETQPQNTTDSMPATVSLNDVPDQIEELMRRSKLSSGRLQLTVLRGPLDRDRFEYTLMLLTPTGERHIGVNVQDSTTIVKSDRGYFLREVDTVSGGSYRTLRAIRDGRPPAEIVATAPNADAVQRLRRMGSVLYRLLVPDRMKEEMARHPDSPISIITNDLELPWELMHDDEFVALTRPVARMPVGRSRARQPATADTEPTKRRVALIASAGSNNELVGSIREVEQIEQGLAKDWKEVQVETFVSGRESRATGERFRELLMSGQFDIIHYAGHALYDQVHQDQSGLLLEDSEVCFAQKIQRLLHGSPLVFLNACESARLRDSGERPPPEGSYEGDPKEGLASAFVYGGALACIGTLWPVVDTVAAEFAVAFYGQVLEGHPLGEAIRVARKVTSEKFPSDPSWASFVLYGDPSFSIATPTRILRGATAM